MVELEEAERNLSNTVFTSPFPARVASSDVQVGKFVRVGQSMMTLNGIDAVDITAEVQPQDLGAALRLLLPNLETLGQGLLTDRNAANTALGLAGIQATVRTTQNGQGSSGVAAKIRCPARCAR